MYMLSEALKIEDALNKESSIKGSNFKI